LIVVSDTSPILNLARIGRLELLPALYHQVIIPEAVYEELTVSKADLPPAIDLSSEPWSAEMIRHYSHIRSKAKEAAVQAMRSYTPPEAKLASDAPKQDVN